MLEFSANTIAQWVGGKIVCGNPETIVSGVAIDSRDVKQNNIFFALTGEVTNGHQYLTSAVKNGATLVIVEDLSTEVDVCQIVVSDTFLALQMLTKAYIKLFPIPFVAITGSSGKTTTKDVTASILAQKYHVLKTQGNLNSTTGVPLTIFDLDHSHEIGVIEMSMSHPGEILGNADIVRPETVVITNIGLCHIEFLQTQENIFKAKSEILTYLGKNDVAVLNADDLYLRTIQDGDFTVVSTGIENGGFRANNITNTNEYVSFSVNIDGEEEYFRFAVPGNHNVSNCLSAIAVGLRYGLSADQIRSGLQSYHPSKNRMEIVSLRSITLINDTYNANPDSMKAAVDVLCHIAKEDRKIAVLCDMYELGEDAAEMHVICGKYAAQSHVDLLLSTGTHASDYEKGFSSVNTDGKCRVFKNKDQLEQFLSKELKENDTVLFKASRGMQLDETFHHIKEKLA